MNRIQEEHQISERHACRLMEFSRSSNRYIAVGNPANEMITKRLIELAARWKRFGYRRLQVMLEREDIHINHKRTYRLYKEAGLSIRKRSKKKRYEKRGMPDRSCLAYNTRWSMDFVCDRTRYGGHIRIMTLIDEATRECLALEVDSSISGKRVAAVLNRVALFRGLPNEILTDNGSEFAGNALNAWSHDHQVEHIFTDPGCPTQNGYIESFNGKLRDECLNQNWFASISEVKKIVEYWRQEYNHEMPHSALDNLTPDEYALKISG